MVRQLLIVLGVGGGVAAGAGPPPAPASNPPAPGLVDGYLAFGVWPQAPGGGPGDPAGYTVHLVPRSDPDAELVFPAGRWLLPARRREVFRFWIEGNGRIGPYQLILHWGLRPPGPEERGSRGHVHPTVPAGTVSWPCPGGALQLRLLALPETVRLPKPWEFLPPAFARRVPCAAGPEGVLMPPGTAVAAVYDREAERYLALSRPFAVTAGRTSRVDPRPPEDAGEQELEIRLEREEPGREVELVLPDGRPASGAELLQLGPPPVPAVLWRGTADGRGRAVLARRAGAALLAARHPEAGVLLVPAPPPEGEPLGLTMPRRAPPLVLRPLRAGGAPAPLPFVRVGVRVGGVWLVAGPPLAVRREDGVVVLDGLPLAPVSVVAWRADPGLDAGGPAPLASRGANLTPPWPGPVDLEVVEP